MQEGFVERGLTQRDIGELKPERIDPAEHFDQRRDAIRGEHRHRIRVGVDIDPVEPGQRRRDLGQIRGLVGVTWQ